MVWAEDNPSLINILLTINERNSIRRFLNVRKNVHCKNTAGCKNWSQVAPRKINSRQSKNNYAFLTLHSESKKKNIQPFCGLIYSNLAGLSGTPIRPCSQVF